MYHNIFISHSSKDDKYVQELKRLLRREGHKIRNFSVDNSTPYVHDKIPSDPEIKKIIDRRIKWSSVIIVLLSRHISQSVWVPYEIRYAYHAKKKLVAVSKSKFFTIPDTYKRYGTFPVVNMYEDLLTLKI